MKFKNQVYTIIVTYNGLKWIHDCIQSVYNTTTVVVVDNNSSDGTVDYIKSHFPEVKIFPQNENLGFGKANNLGITYALSQNADFVFLLNQDALVFGEAIEQLVNFSTQYPKYGILSPIHCDWTGNYLESSFANYVSYEVNEDFYSDFVLNKPKKEVYDINFIAAACWFIPKKTLLDVGGFDPIFFHIGEDSNYAQRILYHNYKIGVLPNCKIGHDTKNRGYSALIKYSEKYFYKNNYLRKVKFADVALSNPIEKAKYLKMQLYKDALFALLQFKFTNFKGALREIKELDLLLKEAVKSAEKNRVTGSHYI